MLLPGADFWRIWACALVLAVVVCIGFHAIDSAHGETLRASFYGTESGGKTADGSRFRPMGFTAAHRTWPFGTRFRACLDRCAIGVVNDRGPARWTGRDIDLSHGMARAIGLERRGVSDITVDRIP